MKPVFSPVDAGEKAAEYFGQHYHCAEAVVAACLEAFGESNIQGAISHATAFGGGFGKSFTQTCGVLSGCMIAIGHFHGRQHGGDSWDIPAGLSETMVNDFQEQHATCHCGTLRDRFGDEKQMEECRKLVRQQTEKLVELLCKELNLDKESPSS